MADRRPLATPFATPPDADPEAVRTFVKQEPREPAPAAGPTAERPPQAVRVGPAGERPAPEARPAAEPRAVPPAARRRSGRPASHRSPRCR